MSILSIRQLCQKILAPILLLPQKRREEKDARVTIRRRIEVTVERETITVMVPGQTPGWTRQTASRERDFPSSRLELPAAQVLGEAANSGKPEPPKDRTSE